MLTLRVRGGELDVEPWVYAWVAQDGVVYVGATALHPATRTWLHLHDDDPDVGRMRARYPGLAREDLEVVALRLPDEIDRQQVRHGAVVALGERRLLSDRHVCDPPLPAEPTAQAAELVAAVERRMTELR
jgi:hypothetical protein